MCVPLREPKPLEDSAVPLVVTPESVKQETSPPAGPRGRGHALEALVHRNLCLRARTGDPFGAVPQETLPPPLLQLPDARPAAPGTYIPRPWLPRMPSAGSGRETPSVEVYPPYTPMEARPPSPPLEVRPPKVEVSSTIDTEAPASSSWGDLVAEAEASGESRRSWTSGALAIARHLRFSVSAFYIFVKYIYSYCISSLLLYRTHRTFR